VLDTQSDENRLRLQRRLPFVVNRLRWLGQSIHSGLLSLVCPASPALTDSLANIIDTQQPVKKNRIRVIRAVESNCNNFARISEKTVYQEFVMSYFLSVVGVVLIIEGMPWFLSPGRTKQFLAQIHSMPDSGLRFFGLFAMLAGLIIVRVSI